MAWCCGGCPNGCTKGGGTAPPAPGFVFGAPRPPTGAQLPNGRLPAAPVETPPAAGGAGGGGRGGGGAGRGAGRRKAKRSPEEVQLEVGRLELLEKQAKASLGEFPKMKTLAEVTAMENTASKLLKI